ncbi:hypothetical protein SAMN02910456_00411 [Ruminococcaceae bacterium YRB3002]|nr:hypothetical protein SAMN02910456_00411 [Ruminococcaceae bacterium YRB3002]
MNISKNKIFTLIYLIVSAMIVIALFAKCPYGFPSDEALYLLVPYRFIHGDIPILHEWHPTQICYIWIHPLVDAYLYIKGNTEGIFLVFRYIYTIVWSLFSFFIYYRLRVISNIGAATVSVMLLIYAPYGSMSLYYNTIGIMTLLSCFVILATAKTHTTIQHIVAGFLFAMAVTCCPYLLILFFLMVVNYAVLRAKGQKEAILHLVHLTLGSIIAFIVFCFYYFRNSSLSMIIGSIHYLLEDREHQYVFGDKLITYLVSLFSPTVLYFLCVVSFVICCIVVSFKKSSTAKKTGFIITVVLILIMQIDLIAEINYINSYMIAPSLLGIYSILFSHKPTIRRIFQFIWIPGLVYTFCLHMSSNLGFSAVASAASLMSAASILSAVVFIEDDFTEFKSIIALFGILSLFQIGLQFTYRMNYVYCESAIKYMTATSDIGTTKGLRITEKRLYYYKYMLNDTLPLRDESIDKVLILSPESWLYLDVNKNIGSYTCWSPYIDGYTIELLDEYYSLYPDMKPSAIYVESYYNDLVPLLNNRGYTGSETPLGGYILYK